MAPRATSFFSRGEVVELVRVLVALVELAELPRISEQEPSALPKRASRMQVTC